MNSATLKSIVLFLLNDVDVKTNENAIELFERWRKTTHYCVKDPLEVKWCLEYLNAMKSFNRDALKRTAIADGFISAWWIKGKRNKKQLMEGKDMSAKRKKDIEEKYTTDRQEKVELFRQIKCDIHSENEAVCTAAKNKLYDELVGFIGLEINR